MSVTVGRSPWDILIHGSVINRFLGELRTATVHIVPPGDDEAASGATTRGSDRQ
jgi:hypothetical protein